MLLVSAHYLHSQKRVANPSISAYPIQSETTVHFQFKSRLVLPSSAGVTGAVAIKGKATGNPDLTANDAFYVQSSREVLSLINPRAYKVAHDIEIVTGDKSDEDILKIIKDDPRFVFRMVLSTMCPICYESVAFYEQSINGMLLSNDEVLNFMKQDIYRNIYAMKKDENCGKFEYRNLLDCVASN
jgi:hypothetical protein